MLSPRWRKVLRDIWLHKSRTALVVLAIAIGIIGAGAVLNTWSILRRATLEEYRSSNPPSATLKIDSIDDALMARVMATPSIRTAQARRTVLASIETKTGWRTAALFAQKDFTGRSVGVLQQLEGTWPPVEGQLVIESSSVDFAGAALGDSLSVRFGTGSSVRLPVAGIARDVGLAPGWMEHVVYGFVTAETLRELGAPSTPNELRIIVRDGAFDRDAVRRTAYELKRSIEATGHNVTSVDVPVPGRHIHAAQIDSLLYIQGAFGLLALFLSAMLVFNLITAMLVGQVREIGVMKAVGAGGQQIALMYLVLALLLGIAASMIALPVAAIIGRLYAEFIGNLLNFNVVGVPVPRRMFAAQLLVGTLLPVFAAAIPVLRGCRISVSQAVRDFGIDPAGAKLAGKRLSNIGGISRPVLLSVRNAFRRRQRMALTLFTLATGGAVYIAAQNLKASVRNSVALLFDSQRFDMSVSFARPIPADSIESAIASVPGVARVEAWSGARASVYNVDSTMGNSFPIIGVPVATKMFVPTAEQGTWLREGNPNGLIINTRLAAEEKVGLGATVSLMTAGKVTPWKVVGIVESGASPSAYASRDAIASGNKNGGMTGAVVAASNAGSSSQLGLVQRVRDELTSRGFEVRSTQLLEQNRKVTEDHLLMVAGFLGVMSWLMIIVGGLGLASTMSLAVLERTREIGVMRAIGARHSSILTMFQVEGFVIAIASWLIALPLSLPMSVILEKAFGKIMIPLPITIIPELSGVFAWLGVVLAVSIIACAWPALRATRITTAAALSYE